MVAQVGSMKFFFVKFNQWMLFKEIFLTFSNFLYSFDLFNPPIIILFLLFAQNTYILRLNTLYLTLLLLACSYGIVYQNFQVQFQKGSPKKIPMSVATMSRQTKRAYLRLCPEKRRKKKNSRGKSLSKTHIFPYI